MRCALMLLVLLLGVPRAAGAERYLTGTLVRLSSIQTPQGSTYDLSIQYKSHLYKVHLVQGPDSQLEWKMNGPVEFRMDKAAFYLKQARGKELRIPMQAATAPPPALPKLALPSVNRKPVLVIENGIPMATSTAPMDSRCAEMAAMGPQFQPLANACAFALSPYSLPNFVCKETTQRSRNGSPLDVVTAQVTYMAGRGDRYSDWRIDGRPVESLEGTGGMITEQLFGRQLRTIFDPETMTEFAVRPDEKVGTGAAAVYHFSYKSANNFTYRLDEVFPSMAGRIWVDRMSGQLMRVETRATDLTPAMSFSSYHSVMNYDDVTIPELGAYLVPVDGEAQMCSASNRFCGRNVVAFRDYRKYGATVKILP